MATADDGGGNVLPGDARGSATPASLRPPVRLSKLLWVVRAGRRDTALGAPRFRWNGSGGSAARGDAVVGGQVWAHGEDFRAGRLLWFRLTGETPRWCRHVLAQSGIEGRGRGATLLLRQAIRPLFLVMLFGAGLALNLAYFPATLSDTLLQFGPFAQLILRVGPLDPSGLLRLFEIVAGSG
ncbi:MAG: hypothetical protein WD557_01045 [Dehalococcoidia bacterium]